jgi:5-hydroxyisourate hydrolase
MLNGLTTHVLDTTAGTPAVGVGLALVRDGVEVVHTATDGDGRARLLGHLDPGPYELRFDLGSYFGGEDPFLGIVPVRFTVAPGTTRLHVPLLASPWSYTTYRGS